MKITKEKIENEIEKLYKTKDLKNFIEESEFKETLNASYNFVSKIGDLQEDLERISSSYTANCLLRTNIELFLVNYYVFYKFILEKKNEVGIHYYKAYFMSECLKRYMYQLGIDGMLKGIKKNATFENLKKKLSPDFDDMSQKDFDNYHKLGKQFDIKNIQNYLLTNSLPNDRFKEINEEFIPKFLSMYNILSSYIHGGPNAEMEYKKDKSNIQNSIEWSRILYYQTIKIFLIMLGSIDAKFLPQKE